MLYNAVFIVKIKDVWCYPFSKENLVSSKYFFPVSFRNWTS